MFKKYFNLILIISFIFHLPLYSKNIDNSHFNARNVSQYFSAIISYDNRENTKALNFFRSSKILLNKHDPYLRKYIFSLVEENKLGLAIQELKLNINKKNSDFFEAYFLLMLDSIKKKDFKKSNFYQKKLTELPNKNTVQLVISETLARYNYLFQNKKISKKENSFGGLSNITHAFEACYLDEDETNELFLNLINTPGVDYNRYIFFYTNFLIKKNLRTELEETSDQIEILNSSLLISQTKRWINNNDNKKINEIFSCENELDILSEFFFLISNIYSTEGDLSKSNFYFRISNHLNPKFKFNLALLAENYFLVGDYKKSKEVLKNFNFKDDLYYWYKVKKQSKIILRQTNKKDSFNYLKSKFKKIKNPSLKTIFDMATISKSFEEYDVAINYFNIILKSLDVDSYIYADILYRRGGSYERLGQYNKSDSDLLKSLEIEPENAYVLNYLAYSWLERGLNIEKAIKMLETAHKKKKMIHLY